MKIIIKLINNLEYNNSGIESFLITGLYIPFVCTGLGNMDLFLNPLNVRDLPSSSVS